MTVVTSAWFLQGHKRAPSDVSVASSEDEKIPLSPLESVPEKMEPILPLPSPAKLPDSNHVGETVSTEEPATQEQPQETPNTPIPEEPEEKPSEENVPEAVSDATSPGSEAKPDTPSKELQQLEIDVEDEKEVDTAEVPGPPQEINSPAAPEANTPAQEEEEDRYKHLKVTLTLPEPEQEVLKKENEEQPVEKDRMNLEEEKKVPDKAKDEKERDSDSGRGSAADNSSVDLNLSISSFLSKTKEPGSVSIQVSLRNTHIKPQQDLFLFDLLAVFLRTPSGTRRP